MRGGACRAVQMGGGRRHRNRNNASGRGRVHIDLYSRGHAASTPPSPPLLLPPGASWCVVALPRLVAAADRGVDLHRLARHDLAPLHPVHARRGRGAHGGHDGRAQVVAVPARYSGTGRVMRQAHTHMPVCFIPGRLGYNRQAGSCHGKPRGGRHTAACGAARSIQATWCMQEPMHQEFTGMHHGGGWSRGGVMMPGTPGAVSAGPASCPEPPPPLLPSASPPAAPPTLEQQQEPLRRPVEQQQQPFA